jgi:hypothetical protein
LVGVCFDEGFEDGRVVGVVDFAEGRFYFTKSVFKMISGVHMSEDEYPDVLLVFEDKVCIAKKLH